MECNAHLLIVKYVTMNMSVVLICNLLLHLLVDIVVA